MDFMSIREPGTAAQDPAPEVEAFCDTLNSRLKEPKVT